MKLYLYLALALALAGAAWRYNYVSNALKAERAQNATLQATLKAERDNRRKADESAKRYAARLALSRGPRSPPPVLLCKLPKASPAAASTASTGANAPGLPDDRGVPEDVDIGPRLDVSFHACEENLIKLEELQDWVRSR